MNTTGPWKCPVCDHKLDTQEVEPYTSVENRRFKYWLFCHNCHTSLIMHTHEYAYYKRNRG